MNDLIELGTFTDNEQTNELIITLKHEGYELHIERIPLQDTTIYNFYNYPELLRISITNHRTEKAKKIVEDFFQYEDNEDSTIDIFDDYTEKELLDVIKNPDEWNKVLRTKAEEILYKKGVQISDEEKEFFYIKKLEESRQQESLVDSFSSTDFLIYLVVGFAILLVGYYFLPYIFIPSFGESVVGIWKGWTIMTHVRKDLSGKYYLAYDKSSRKFGLYLVILSVCLLPIAFIFDFILI